MARPIPGQQYIVRRGDTFEGLALRAYGDAVLWERIYEANQVDTVDDLLPGLIILIPLLPEDRPLKTDLAKAQLRGKDKYDLTIIIDGAEINPLSARVRRQFDTCADGWTATIDWTPGQSRTLDKIVAPFLYLPASVYIGGNLIINGLVYDRVRRLTSSGRSVDLAGWSYSVDAVDSTLKPPYERRDENLEQAAYFLVRPLGIRAVFDVDPGEPFKRMTAEASDTIFVYLSKYAVQRGILVSSTSGGDLRFVRAITDQPVLGTIKESIQPVQDWSVKYEGRKLYNVYRATGQSPGNNAKAVISVDDRIPRSRFFTFSADDTTKSDIQNAADWRRSKQLAEALKISLPVTDWYAPNGELWQEGKLVTVVSEVLGVPRGFNFLIRSVEFEFTTGGKTAKLDLVPPQVYTTEKIDWPWELENVNA